MRPLRLFVLLAGAMMVQWFVPTYFSIAGTAPQILLLLTTAVAAVGGPIPGQCLGFIWGIFLDSCSGHVFGANALALSLTAYVVGRLRKQMDVTGSASQAFLAAVISPTLPLTLGGIAWIFEHAFIWPGWAQVLAGPLYAALLAPIAFKAVEKAYGGRS